MLANKKTVKAYVSCFGIFKLYSSVKLQAFESPRNRFSFKFVGFVFQQRQYQICLRTKIIPWQRIIKADNLSVWLHKWLEQEINIEIVGLKELNDNAKRLSEILEEAQKIIDVLNNSKLSIKTKE